METVQSLTGNLSGGLAWIAGAAGILSALISCFFGYRLLKVWTTLIGFIAGFCLGSYLSEQFVDSSWIPVAVGLVTAALFAALAFKAYMAGVFLVGGLWAFAVSVLLIQADTGWMFLLCGGIGLVTGIFAVWFVKPVIIVVSSLQGGVQLSALTLSMLHIDQSTVLIITGVVIGILGMIFQFLNNRRDSSAEKDKRSHT
mgnify:CR=1 FL=1